MHKFTGAELEKYASVKGVKRIAVENFLSSLNADIGAFGNTMNLHQDAKMYKWNESTVRVIEAGIRHAFSPRPVGKYGKLSDRARHTIKSLEQLKCEADDTLTASKQLKYDIGDRKTDVRRSIKSILERTGNFGNGKPDKFAEVNYDNNGIAINSPKGYRQAIPGSMGMIPLDKRRYKKEGKYWEKKPGHTVGRYGKKDPWASKVKLTPAQKKAKEAYEYAIKQEDRYLGSVFVTPRGQRDYEEKRKVAYEACKRLGMGCEHGM